MCMFVCEVIVCFVCVCVCGCACVSMLYVCEVIVCMYMYIHTEWRTGYKNIGCQETKWSHFEHVD